MALVMGSQGERRPPGRRRSLGKAQDGEFLPQKVKEDPRWESTWLKDHCVHKPSWEDKDLGVALQTPPGSQASPRGEAKDSALLSSRDAGLLA